MIEEMLEYSLLYDFYGNLLNEKQKRVIEMFYMEDLSLSEIGAELEITKQAVYDNLKRAERNLKNYEEKLLLIDRFNINKEIIKEIKRLFKETNLSSVQDKKLLEILMNIERMIEENGN